MEFEILSHACLRVTHGATTLIVDPWLKGSAYWRSWWNYPPVDAERASALRADYVYLSHIHWDHFHGPTLRALGKQTQILIPEDRYPRMIGDLRSMGFSNVREVPHGKTVRLADDLSVTPFLFFPFTDSALVIEGGGTTLLDANDCKICGLPLRQIKRRFPCIDFVLRSHSSANTRVCHEYLDAPAQTYELVDSQEDYLRSFSNFMSAVRPRYAIPFASNHCHLHKDARRFNRWQQTPKDVRDYFARHRSETGLTTELVTMLPGSLWSESKGFSLSPESRWFSDRESQIEAYAEANRGVLDDTYVREGKVSVSIQDMRRFFERVHAHLPWFWRRRLRGRPVYFKSLSGDERGALEGRFVGKHGVAGVRGGIPGIRHEGGDARHRAASGSAIEHVQSRGYQQARQMDCDTRIHEALGLLHAHAGLRGIRDHSAAAQSDVAKPPGVDAPLAGGGGVSAAFLDHEEPEDRGQGSRAGSAARVFVSRRRSGTAVSA